MTKLICPYCNREMKLNRFTTTGKIEKLSITKQHLLPKRRGGTYDKENIKPCCHDCNVTLNYFDDCIGALECYRALAEKYGWRYINRGAKSVYKQLKNTKKIKDKNLERIKNASSNMDI